MKSTTILGCLSAILIISLQAHAWQAQDTGSQHSYRPGVQTYKETVQAQPSGTGYDRKERGRSQPSSSAGQLRAFGSGSQPNPFNVRVPVKPDKTHVNYTRPEVAEPAPDYSPGAVYQYPRHQNPYYSEDQQRDVFTEALDWFLSIPAGVVSRFSEGGDSGVFPEMPATQGSGQAPTARQGSSFNEESGVVHVVPPPSPYESFKRRR